MSKVLPAELRTKKVKSLQGDLKNIAEELLAEKFGIEEEVVERRAPDPFRPGYGCNDPFCESCYGGDSTPRHEFGRDALDPRFGFPSTQGIRTTLITLEGCYEILKRLERDVGPSLRRRNTEWRMGRREFDDLTRDRRSEGAIRFGRSSPELFGIPVRLAGRDTFEIELICY